MKVDEKLDAVAGLKPQVFPTPLLNEGVVWVDGNENSPVPGVPGVEEGAENPPSPKEGVDEENRDGLLCWLVVPNKEPVEAVDENRDGVLLKAKLFGAEENRLPPPVVEGVLPNAEFPEKLNEEVVDEVP
jgi:hypothetical protein